VRDNTITWSYPPSVVIAVAGSANVIDGNIGAITEPPGVPPRANVGIAFRADGNFYGDNRLEATVLIDAAGTMQTDWGGNVAF
jgi:hypothetical protein